MSDEKPVRLRKRTFVHDRRDFFASIHRDAEAAMSHPAQGQQLMASIKRAVLEYQSLRPQPWREDDINRYVEKMNTCLLAEKIGFGLPVEHIGPNIVRIEGEFYFPKIARRFVW